MRVIKRTQWSSRSIVLPTYTSMLFALVYIDGILQSAKRLLVQFSCPSFYSWDNSWQYLFLKGLYSKDFIVYYIGPIGYPFHFFHCTLLFLAPLFLVLVLSPPKSFPMFFFSSVVFSSNISSFFPIVPNTPNQIFYHPIYIMSLPYIFLVVLLYKTLYNLLFLLVLTFFYILLQISLPSPLYSLNSPLVPKCLLLLYIPSIIPDTYLFL